jgi:predicted phage terminase large subunit-like protein
LKKSLIENGEITWDYYNDENIEELKKQQWEIAFNQNYLLIPFSWWDTIIKRDQIKYYRDIKIFDKIIIWIDPAISEKTHSDSFWIVITWIIQGKYYVIEAIELKEKEKDPFKATEIIYNLYTKYNANLVVVETVAFQQVMAKLIKNKWIAIKEVKPRKDKMTRLLERQYLFDKWEIFFNNENTWTLINQLLDFPNVQHDDLVDWMIYSFQKNDKKFIFEQL